MRRNEGPGEPEKKNIQGLFIEGIHFGILKKRSLFETDPEEYMTLRIFPDGKVYLCRCKGFEGLDIFDMVEHDKRAMFVRQEEGHDKEIL